MLQAYIDDCDPAGAPVYVLGGFVANVEKWASFYDEWDSVLKLHPKIEYFRMREANGLSGQFFGWKEELRDERVHLLIEVILKYVEHGIYSGISKEMHTEVFGIAPKPYTIFFLNFHALFAAMYKHQTKIGDSQRTRFIFDEQIIKNDIRRTLSQVWDGAPEYMRELFEWPPQQEDDKKVLPLQAADLLAWRVRREYYCKHVERVPFHWPWKSLAPIKLITFGWDSKTLIQYRDRIIAAQREETGEENA